MPLLNPNNRSQYRKHSEKSLLVLFPHRPEADLSFELETTGKEKIFPIALRMSG